MTIMTPGKIKLSQPRSARLRDLTDKRVRDEIAAEARRDANSSLARQRRVAERREQDK